MTSPRFHPSELDFMKDSEVLKDAYLRYEALRRVTPIFWGPNGDGFLTQKVAIPKASPGGSSPASWIVIFLRCMFFFEHMLRTGHCMLLKNAAGGRQGKTHLETSYSITSPNYLSKGALDPQSTPGQKIRFIPMN